MAPVKPHSTHITDTINLEFHREDRRTGRPIPHRETAHMEREPRDAIASPHCETSYFQARFNHDAPHTQQSHSDAIARVHLHIVHRPTAPDVHGDPDHNTHPSADYPVPLPFGRNPPKRASKG